MKARIQGNLRKTIAEVFMSDLDAGKNSYYLMLSHPTPWVNDAVPPSPRDTTQNKTDVWKNALALKKIEQEDVRLVIPRIDWKINKKYEQYEDNVGIDDNPQSATGIIENYVELLEKKIIDQDKQLQSYEKELERLREQVKNHNNLRELRIAWANGEIEN